jgi:hypothetical protein
MADFEQSLMRFITVDMENRSRKPPQFFQRPNADTRTFQESGRDLARSEVIAYQEPKSTQSQFAETAGQVVDDGTNATNLT